jgi:hypothetical protein
VGLLVLAFHAVWIAAFLASGHEARDFVRIGYRFVQQSSVSPAIKFDPSYHYPPNPGAADGNGYDGEFGYYMALDPVNARYYMDEPAYRYTRVVYPLLAAVLALGRPDLVPYTLLLVNWLAIGLGTVAVAAWLRRRGSHPAFALLFGLYPGLLVGLQRDLTEPLAYAITAFGVYLRDARRSPWPAAVAFGVAGLARQTTIVFPAAYAVAMLLAGEGPLVQRARRNLPRATGFMLVAAGPIVAWTLFLRVWLGAFGRGSGLDAVPLLGLARFLLGRWHLAQHVPLVVAVLAPSILWIAVTVLVYRRRGLSVELALFWVNSLLFLFWIGSINYTTYTQIGRDIVGVILAALLCVPLLGRGRATENRLAGAAILLWLSILPVVLVYGFLNIKVT